MADIITTLHPESDENTNLYPNIKKDNIPNNSIDRTKLSDDVNSLLNSINELHPSGTTTSTNLPTTNQGILIATDNGHWYYWNGTQYVDGGVYQAAEIADGSITCDKLGADVKTVILTSYNLVEKTMVDYTINSSGVISISTDNTDVHIAKVESGKTYYIQTNEDSLVLAYYTSYPNVGSSSYDGRHITSNPITSPVDGYIAFRSLTGYEYAQMVEGTEPKEYLPHLIGYDLISRTRTDELLEVTEDLPIVYDKVVSKETKIYDGLKIGDTFNMYAGSYYSICKLEAGEYLEKIDLLAQTGSNPGVMLGYIEDNTFIRVMSKTLATSADNNFHTYNINYKVDRECYVLVNSFGFNTSGESDTHIIVNPSTYAYEESVSTAKFTVNVYSYHKSDLEIIENEIISTKMLSSDISMFEHIGFCGDSYMAGMIVVSENPTVTAQNTNLCWGKILERTHGINAYIYAKGGVKASDFITDTDCLPKLLNETAKQLYVISLGHNDAYHQTPVTTFKENYRTILNSIIQHAPNAKIILCKQSRGYGDMNNGPELNVAIGEIAEEYNIPVLNPEDDPYLSSDIYVTTQVHNHPVFAGYAGMAQAFNRLFNKATVDYFDYFKQYTGL